jgi:hypothetical protein
MPPARRGRHFYLLTSGADSCRYSVAPKETPSLVMFSTIFFLRQLEFHSIIQNIKLVFDIRHD